MKNKNFRLLALFILIIISWGLAWPAAKVGLDYMSPLWYTVARLVIGTVAMTSIVIGIGKFSWPTTKDIPLLIVIGVLQLGIFLWLTNIGLAYIPAGRSSLLTYTTPLWVIPIATFFFKERSTKLQWLGFWLGVLGLLVLLSPWEMEWADPDTVFGVVILLLASLIWSISMLGTRYLTWTKTPLELIPWQLLIAAVPMLIYAFIQEPEMQVVWSSSLLWSLAYTGILVTGFSYWGGVIINKELPTTIVSIGFLAVPVLSLLVSSVYMHEAISLTTTSAIGLILLGLVCIVM